MTPFSGKLVWFAGFLAMALIGGTIWFYYRGYEAWVWLGFASLGPIGAWLMMQKHNRDRAKRLDAQLRASSEDTP